MVLLRHFANASLLGGYATAAPLMNLTLEVYRDIVRYTGNRADIASLCRVSKAFQHVAQRALYNTLYVRTVDDTLSVCTAIATNPRLAEFVDALTVFYPDPGPESDSDDETSSLVDEAQVEVPPDYWSLVSRALQSTTHLRFLNIHVNDYEQRNVAWILDGCTFRLRHFHCDLDWDPHLVAFLNTQTELNDLYLIDYNESRKTDHDSHTVDDTNASGSEPLSAPTLNNPEPADSPLSPKAADVKGKLALNSTSLPSLSTLECTFSEAAISIVPGRPVTRLKTCFSSSTLPQKRAEMALLFSKLKLSSRSLHSLDLSDSEYSESFAMEMLRAVVQSKAMTRSLRYLGTLVLPIMGKERLQFYGLLMRLPRITCIELDVSEWDPPPISPPAFRALASELRIYIPNITRVIFVHEYERTAVRAMPDGMCKVEPDVNWEFIWREV